MFYWDDKNYPYIGIDLWDLSKVDLRYLRNLVYAKHGYIFKSKDLQDVYESFSWYRRNPSFSHSDISAGEKKLLNRIKGY